MLFSVMAQSRWLCKLAGKQALQQHAAALLRTPNPPGLFPRVVQLAGLQVTAADLVAAARCRTPGVENWVLQLDPLVNKQLDPLVKAVHQHFEVSFIPAANTCDLERLQDTFVTVLARSICKTDNHQPNEPPIVCATVHWLLAGGLCQGCCSCCELL
jgi:hypothetical protein